MAKTKKFVEEDVEVETEEEIAQVAEELAENPELVLVHPHYDSIPSLRFQDSNGQVLKLDAGWVRGEYTLRPVIE